MEKLLASLGHGLPQVADRLINQISADGWKAFLNTVIRANAKALYKYLAKEASGGSWEVAAEDLSPLRVGDRQIVSGSQKSEAIAEHFAAKLKATAQAREGEGLAGSYDQ